MTPFVLDAQRALRSLAAIRRPTADAEQAMSDYCRAVWTCVVEPGDGVAGALIQALGPEDALREALGGRGRLAADAAEIDEREWRNAVDRWRPRLVAAPIEAALAQAAIGRASLLVPGDAEWPGRVDDLGPYRPVAFWVRGRVGPIAGPGSSIAIVGARASTAYGDRVASEISGELAGRGVTVVSGAAYGIDGSAHRAALAVEGRTIALVAGGVDRLYPSGHAELLARIAARGAILSEAPCGATPTRWRFLQRNRVIAAISDGTVVVEAGGRSGSLNTAHHAADLGRPLGAVPGPVTSATSVGCHELLRARLAECITSPEDAAALIGLAGALRAPETEAGGDRPYESRTDDRTRVRDALSPRAWRDVDDVARRCGMSPAEVTGRLGLMLLDGEAERRDGRWRRAGKSDGGAPRSGPVPPRHPG